MNDPLMSTEVIGETREHRECARTAEQPLARTEFPRALLPFLRCSLDAGQLKVSGEARSGSVGIIEAALQCCTCSAKYSIQDGIARLMIQGVSAEEEHEMALRDREYAGPGPVQFVPPSEGWRSEFSDRLEIPSHLAALAPLFGSLVLELGCGDGRFTILMAQLGARIIAVDFSINGLRKVASRLPLGLGPTTYRLGTV